MASKMYDIRSTKTANDRARKAFDEIEYFVFLKPFQTYKCHFNIRKILCRKMSKINLVQNI